MESYLLDTMTVLWMAAAPERLSQRARTVLENESNVLHFTIVNLWEIAIKMSGVGYDEFELPDDWSSAIPAGLRDQGIPMLNVEPDDCGQMQNLTMHHRDPFDRMIIAQALRRSLKILGTDRRYDDYGVERVW